jgi:hypothetical protein
MNENIEADKLSLSCRVVATKATDERGKQSVVKNTGHFLFKRLLFKDHKNGQSEKKFIINQVLEYRSRVGCQKSSGYISILNFCNLFKTKNSKHHE